MGPLIFKIEFWIKIQWIFRVSVPITNTIIGPLLINRKGYHKNKTCSRFFFESQYEVFFKFCDCSYIKSIFSQANLQVGQTNFHHNANLDISSKHSVVRFFKRVKKMEKFILIYFFVDYFRPKPCIFLPKNNNKCLNP